MDEFDSLAPIEAEVLVATCDASGSMIYRNRSWIRSLGDDPDPWVRFPAPDSAEARKLLDRALRGEVLTNQLFLPVPAGTGSPKPVLLHFIPSVPATAGRPGPSAVTISGEVLAQPESWTASQAERHRMETLGRMTMGMAHDFNNLLSAVLGHVDLMRLSFASAGDACGLGEHVATIERAARDGASLIEKVQRYIRQEHQAAYQPVDLSSLVRDCVSLTRPYWYNEPRRQGIEIVVRQDLGPVPPVLGSASELRDVVVNLVLNAVQAMPQGGTLRFETRVDADRVSCSVIDSGIGMSEAVRARIFEPLFTTKGNLGNGMGLAVAHGVILEHGGSFTVESAPDKGSRFTFAIPRAPDVVDDQGPEPPATATSAARILVVDDEAMVRTVLRRLLTLRGHTVDEAESGAEGLTRSAGARYDLVITDQGMPGMSGREMASLMKARDPRTPIVLLTGDTHTGTADGTVDRVLTKPFRIEEIEAAIRQLV